MHPVHCACMYMYECMHKVLWEFMHNGNTYIYYFYHLPEQRYSIDGKPSDIFI